MPRNEHRFVGVTYGEFQSLYCYGRATIPRGRVVSMRIKRDGSPSTRRRDVSGLLATLPQLMLGDHEGVVILELAAGQSKTAGRPASEVFIGDVENVIPTTQRARRILEPRLRSLGVELSQPHFEASVLEQWSWRNVTNAVDGGRELCRVLFEDDVLEDEKLRHAVETAIRHLDRQDGQEVDDTVATWIPAAFRFTRHDPYDYGSIDYLMDSGKILSRLPWPPESKAVERCRDVVRGMIGRRSEVSSLADVVRDSDVENLAMELQETVPGCFPPGFRSLVIFCRWKELFHRWREAVDVEALAAEARELLAARVDYSAVMESLWLLGCFAGHERVAHLRYAAERHSWSCGPVLSMSKIADPSSAKRRGSDAETDAVDGAATETEKADQGSGPRLPLD